MIQLLKKYQQLMGLLLISLFVAGCGGSSSTAAGSDPDPVVSSTMASKISVDPLTRLVTAEVTVAGFTATAVHIHEGATGATGAVLITLAQDPLDADKFVSADGARLTEAQYAGYLAGETYFNSHSTANPAGEVREQIVAKTIDTSNVVVDEINGLVSGYVMVSGFTPTVAHIHTGFAGTTGAVAVTLTADPVTAGKFDIPAASSIVLADYNAGKLYFNVHSADFAAGHIREQMSPANVQVLGIEITGAQVAPTAITGGGSATAYLTVDETSGDLNVVLNLHNISNSTNAHIHDGATGVAGGILQGFTGAANDTTWTISGVTLASGAASPLEKLLAGNTYINVHTATNTGGEARGQISPAPSAIVSTMASKISVDPLTRLVSGEITVAGFTATNAHIHAGAVGVSGGVVLQLVQDATNANKWTTADGARLTLDQYSSYLAGGLYFNSHSAANLAGEVRTQIDPVTIDTSNVVFDGVTGAVSGFITVGGFTPTNAHIHTGFAGSTGGVVVTLEADATTAGRFNLPAAATVTVADYNAGKLYFNVHSSDFAAGHIREQIVPAGIQVLGVEVTGTQSVPEVTGGGSATAYITVNETTGAVDATVNLHSA